MLYSENDLYNFLTVRSLKQNLGRRTIFHHPLANKIVFDLRFKKTLRNAHAMVTSNFMVKSLFGPKIILKNREMKKFLIISIQLLATKLVDNHRPVGI